MKRALMGASLFVAAAMLTVSPALATSSKHPPQPSATCKKIDAAMAAGKSTKEVEKQFKVSSKTIQHCQKTVAAASSNGAAQAQ